MTPSPKPAAFFVCAALVISGWQAVEAQSFNVDFGAPGTAPSATYGAAGLPGTWNVVGALNAGQRQNLVDLAGAASSARIYQIGGAQILENDVPGTTGDDAGLMDDMFIGFNNPVDVCIWVENLVPGDYQVLIYAMTPGDPSLLSRVRVDDGNPGPTMVGGAWPGSHQAGVTYAAFNVTITGTVIGLHSGLPSGMIQSGINGIQIRSLAGTAVGDGAAPAVEPQVWVTPNPASGPQTFVIAAAGTVRELAIVDPAGRIVWRSGLPLTGGGRQSLVWDGRGASGRLVPAGTYFLRLDGRAAAKLQRLD
ncbi:MAG TPA: hypothetical protein VNM87_07040 [Candidatus Udaeobacter sp.]|nr:hypothetical protein [Candidatus Udaeobacter sp.]